MRHYPIKPNQTESIHVFRCVIQAIRQHREEFPVLYAEYKEQSDIRNQRKRTPRNHAVSSASWLYVSPEAYAEYETIVTNYLTCQTHPDDNRTVVITTHTTGQLPAFYKDGEWQYYTAGGALRDVADIGIVMRWRESAT